MEKKDVPNFYKTAPLTTHKDSSTKEIIDSVLEPLESARDEMMEKRQEGSNFSSKCINKIYLKLHKLEDPGARSYIITPKFLYNKKCTITSKNIYDNMYFLWCVTTAIYRHLLGKTPGYIGKRIKELSKSINTNGISFPPQRDDYDRFEKNNKHIALAVYEFTSSEKIKCLRKSKHFCNREYNIDLLVIKDKKDNDIRHFLLITNFKGLIRGIYHDRH